MGGGGRHTCCLGYCPLAACCSLPIALSSGAPLLPLLPCGAPPGSSGVFAHPGAFWSRQLVLRDVAPQALPAAFPLQLVPFLLPSLVYPLRNCFRLACRFLVQEVRPHSTQACVCSQGHIVCLDPNAYVCALVVQLFVLDLYFLSHAATESAWARTLLQPTGLIDPQQILSAVVHPFGSSLVGHTLFRVILVLFDSLRCRCVRRSVRRMPLDRVSLRRSLGFRPSDLDVRPDPFDIS